MSGACRAMFWLEPQQVVLARAVAEHAGLTVAMAGSPTRGQSGAVASELDAEARDDLRAALASEEAGVVCIFAPGDFGTAEDAASLRSAGARGVRVATLEPLPARAVDLVGEAWRWRPAGSGPAFVPRLASSRVWQSAWAGAEEFGPARSACVVALGRAEEGSLGARLLDAMDALLAVLGEPEAVDAAYAGDASVPGLHPLPGESLRDLHGDISANLRFSGGRAAALLASDRAARWSRSMVVVAPGGTLRGDDGSLRWSGPGGDEAGEGREAPGAAELIAEGVRALLEPSRAEVEPEAALVCCQAALLSARTGQSESPGTIRRMLGAG